MHNIHNKTILDDFPSSLKRMNRRQAAVALLIAAPVMLATRSAAAACVDMNALSPSDRSVREALEFKLHAPDAAKQCHSCAFFEPAGEGCGRCQLLSGGPVLPDSVCSSWAKKG